MSTIVNPHESENSDKKSIVKTSMKADKPKHPFELGYEQWEKSYHNDLIQLYKNYFEKNEKFECTYEDFVTYCYNHSSKQKSPIAYE